MIKMDTQQFKLYVGEVAQFGGAYVKELENISTKTEDSILTIMRGMRGIKESLLSPEIIGDRWVAVGNCGDCVIYENDTIAQVSDSG